MEFAVYEVFRDGDGRRMGSFVNMLASGEEAARFVQERPGEHEIVELWTREIAEEDEHLWDTVVFEEGGGVEPVGTPGRTGRA